MKIFKIFFTVATVLATISFFAFNSARTTEDNLVDTCSNDTMAIEVDTLSPKAIEEMDSKTVISLTKPLSPLETSVTVETTTSEDNIESATTRTTPTANVETTSSVENTLPVEITESMEIMTSTEVTTSASHVTTAPKSELAKVTTTASSSETTGSTFTTTFVSSTEATSSSATTTEPCVTVYKKLTISDSVNRSDVIPGTTLHLMLIDSENHCLTSETEVSEDGYVTFAFLSNDEYLIKSGIYRCYCPELGTKTTIELD